MGFGYLLTIWIRGEDFEFVIGFMFVFGFFYMVWNTAQMQLLKEFWKMFIWGSCSDRLIVIILSIIIIWGGYLLLKYGTGAYFNLGGFCSPRRWTVMNQPYICMKCNGTESGISRFLNVQNQKKELLEYATLSCSECGYTELYCLDGSEIGNIVDLFTN